MLKILFILPDLQGGGAERVVLTVIRGLDRERFEPTLFLLKKSGVYWSEIPKGVKVISVLESHQRIRNHLPKILFNLFREAKKMDLVVGALELVSTYLAVIVSKLLKLPSIGWVHINIEEFGVSKEFPNPQLIRWLYPYLNQVIAVSKGVGSSLLKKIPKLNNRLSVIYNPIEIKSVQEMSGKEEGYQLKKPLVLAVGRLNNAHKGFDVLIKAHGLLVNKGVNHNLMILGEGDDRDQLESLIRKLGLEKTVVLAGFQSNPYYFMKNADVFVVSSRYEGFSMVILEALAMGLPVISSDCPSGPSEILDDGKYGLLVPSGNVDELARGIERLLTQKKMADNFRTKGLGRAVEFSPKIIVPQFERVFSELVKRP